MQSEVVTTFYLAPPEGASWDLTPEQFAEAIASRWPATGGGIKEFPQGGRYADFWVPEERYDGIFDGGLIFRRQTPEDSAEFIVWFLGLLPEDARIRFTSERAVEDGIRDDWWLPRDASPEQVTTLLAEHLSAVIEEE